MATSQILEAGHCLEQGPTFKLQIYLQRTFSPVTKYFRLCHI